MVYAAWCLFIESSNANFKTLNTNIHFQTMYTYANLRYLRDFFLIKFFFTILFLNPFKQIYVNIWWKHWCSSNVYRKDIISSLYSLTVCVWHIMYPHLSLSLCLYFALPPPWPPSSTQLLSVKYRTARL